MKKEFTKEFKLFLQACNVNQLEQEFFNACSNGMLETVQYILTSKDLVSIDIDVKDKEDNNGGLVYAVIHSQMEVVKYLLTSPELKVHANIENSIKFACIYNQIESLKYLLKNSQLENEDYRHKEEAKGLQASLLLNGFSEDKNNSAYYLVFEENIEESKHIKNSYLYEEKIKKLFMKRQLDTDLTKQKSNKTILNSKI